MNNKLILSPWLGCIADDYTGATDLASFLVASGLRTIQLNGLPDENLDINLSEYDAIVIALKSRTCAVKQAVDDSLKSLRYLQEAGCLKYYFKYCSTFDSTHEGNIGPVIDSLMEELKVKSTVVCPALPVNGRTVKNGHLYVNGILLNESPMKDHPLTPMSDSSIERMIETQGKGKAALISFEVVEQGQEAIQSELKKASTVANYLVIDALATEHLVDISHSLSDFKLITGGSGIAVDLAAEYETLGGKLNQAGTLSSIHTKGLVVLSGSCSAMTQSQVAEYAKSHPSMQLNPLDVANGKQSVEGLTKWMLENIESSPLIYASTDADTIKQVHNILGKEQAAELVEHTFCQLAGNAKRHGVGNFIIAGGETSGAVVNELKIKGFEIGQSIEPSVPVVTTVDKQPIKLALKSGNFGQIDFFSKAKRKLICS